MASGVGETTTALVPYEALKHSESSPLCALEASWRRVDIGGRVVEIEQSWSRGALGGAVWLASIALATYIAGAPGELWRGKRALELGAGAGGLPSIAMARAGATVLATDGDEAVVPVLARNLERNGADVRTQLFRWDGDITDVLGHQGEAPDVILIADAVYGGTRNSWHSLLALCRQLSRRHQEETHTSSLTILLAHTHRYQNDDDAFFALARQRGFRVTQLLRGEKNNKPSTSSTAIYELHWTTIGAKNLVGSI